MYIRHNGLNSTFVLNNNFKIRNLLNWEKFMARRFMIKLIMMMTDLVIFILVDVHANEQTLYSFHSSSLRSPLPLPSKLDDVQGPFYLCLESFITGCSKDQKQKRYLYLVCIAGAYPKCFRHHKDYEDDPLYKKTMEGYENCVKKHKSIIYRGEFYVYGSISISKSIDISLYPKSKSKLQF